MSEEGLEPVDLSTEVPVHHRKKLSLECVHPAAEADEAVAKMMEESPMAADEMYGYDSGDERPAERWAPLGAASVTPPDGGEQSHGGEVELLRNMEEEQEMLNSSLLALTTHFAQVQFRLKQIVAAQPDDKEILLKELEEFAFKGIPDVRGCKTPDAQIMEEMSERECQEKFSAQREKQQELVEQLKSQLQDLEIYQYQIGEGELPSSQVMEKQKVLIDQLTSKLHLNLDDFEHLSMEDLRHTVDSAIGQIVNPAKVKEKLVDQLKTQIVDLERFIDFLQGESQSPGPLGERCTCPKHNYSSRLHGADKTGSKVESDRAKGFRQQTLGILRQTLTVLQIFAISQFGCGGREFQQNLLKRTTKGNHWGDLRARLELSIQKVHQLQLDDVQHVPAAESTYSSDGEEQGDTAAEEEQQCSPELTAAVRKELAMALRDLLQHGLMEVGQSTSLVPFGCFPSRGRNNDGGGDQTKMMHAWDLFMKYYEMKHGKEYNQSPARKLSQSFSLEMVGGRAITAKQTLLTAVEEVLASHMPLKRSEDSMFKAFVCLGLNQKKLVTWLRLILRTTLLIEYYYQPWSYVVKTGFDDSLVSLDRLSQLDFRLPMDLAVRPFRNIRDAF